jgi:hypothetical protein
LPNELIVPVTFPFFCIYRPKRGRNDRREYLLAQEQVALCCVERSEVEVAYRIVHPDGYTSEVISHDGELWWLFHMDRSRLLKELKSYLFGTIGLLPPEWRGYRRKEALKAADGIDFGSITENRRDPAYVRVQSLLSDSLLLIGEEVYVRGSRPIFVYDVPRRPRDMPRVRCVSAPPERAIHPDTHELSQLEYADQDWVESALRRGNFDLGDHDGSMAGIGLLPGVGRPTLEVVASLAQPLDRPTILLDALFRGVHGFVHGEPRNGWVHDLSEEQERSVAAIATETSLVSGISTATDLSSGRHRCLEMFAAFMADNADMRIAPYFADLPGEVSIALAGPDLRRFAPSAAMLSEEEDATVGELWV